MSHLQPGEQPDAERRSAEAQVRAIIVRLAPTHGRLIDEVRGRMRRRLHAAYELVYEYRGWFVISYSASEHGYEGVVAIRASAEGVKLYFNNGKQLADPGKLLRGSGERTRWMHLEGADTLGRAEVVGLIEGAVALSRVPFASEGGGAVVIRSASAG